MSRNDAPETSPSARRTDEILLGALQHMAGVALVLTAWVLVLTDQARAAASALLPGLLIVTLYGARHIRFSAVLERTVLLLGAGTIVAPWALGFAANDSATWSHIVLGGLAVASAATWLTIARRAPASGAASSLAPASTV